MSIKIKNTILQFPNLFEAKGFQDSKPVYSAKLLISKKDEDIISTIKLRLKHLCEENKIIFKPDSFKCFKDGETTGIDKYADYYVLTAKANIGREPKVIDGELKLFKGTVLSGDIANVAIDFWNYSYGAVSKGIACNLIAVQLTQKSDDKFKTTDEIVIEDTFDKIESEELPF